MQFVFMVLFIYSLQAGSWTATKTPVVSTLNSDMHIYIFIWIGIYIYLCVYKDQSLSQWMVEGLVLV